MRLQRERFEEVLAWYDARSLPRPVAHLANSGAVLQHPDSWLDLVRPGILLYGVLPDDRLDGGHPATARDAGHLELPPDTPAGQKR